ncbi:hypothetical protein RCL1_006734 [Eukaryota sp. TZLM3-RCL]
MSYSCLHRNCSALLEDYKEIDRIGAGSQGVAYLVTDKENKFYCLKKILNPSTTKFSEISVSNRELNSPFLVDFHHCFTGKDDAYLLMEYCHGGSLYQLLESKPSFSEQDIMDIYSQLVLAVKYLHEEGILHRDIKPGNILLVAEERPFRVKLCDFGIARELHATTIKSACGTELFMAPEMFSNEPYGTAVDIWAIGVVLYLLVEGKYPFKSPFEILTSNVIFSNSPFKNLLTKLLNKNPNMRPSANELAQNPRVLEYHQQFLKQTTPLDLETLQADISELQTKNKELEATVQQLLTGHSSLEQKFEEFQQLHRKQQSTLSKQQDQINELQQSNQLLLANLDHHESTYRTLQNELTLLKSQTNSTRGCEGNTGALEMLRKLRSQRHVSSSAPVNFQNFPLYNHLQETTNNFCLTVKDLEMITEIRIINSPDLETLNDIQLLSSLHVLELENCCRLRDISRVSDVPSITKVHLKDCNLVTDVTPLALLPNLVTLRLFKDFKVRFVTKRPYLGSFWFCDFCGETLPSETTTLHCNDIVGGFDVCLNCCKSFSFGKFDDMLSSKTLRNL